MNAWRKQTKGSATREELGTKPLIMDLQSPGNKKWLRAVALFLVIAFVNQDIIWAQGGDPVWAKGANGSFNLKPKVNGHGDVSIPKDIAVTKDVYSGANGKTIINIQDAHASLTAQESIVSILDSLVTNYDLKLVAIEGSSGYIDTSLLKTFPDESIRKASAKYLMKKGKLSAGEFFSVTSDKEIALYGIESKKLYTENVEQFKKIYEINGAISKDIRGLTAAFEDLKDKIYSTDLKQLERNSVLHKDGKIGFSDRWEFVYALASKYNISYKKYENLAKLVESLKYEKKINFNKATKERDALIDALSKKVVKQDLEQMVLKSVSFKMNKLSQGEYYLYLQELASRYGIDPVPYGHLINYTNYIALYESIDIMAIFEEVKAYEDEIEAKLFTNEYQKKLHDFSGFVDLVSNLYELKLSNGDLEAFVVDMNKFNAADIAQFIKAASLKYGVTINGDYDLGAIFDNIPTALSFYRTAEERNTAILANTINRMDREGQNVAALVTGGFHTKGLTEILKQKETSYIVILPKFDASKGDRPYVAILTNKKDPYEDLIRSGKCQILAEEYLGEGISDPIMTEAFIVDVIMTNLAVAAIEKKNVDSVAQLWIDSYARAYDNLKTKGIIKEPPAGVQEKPFVWTYGYRTVEVLKDGTIENRPSSAGEVEEYKNAYRKEGAAKGKTVSFEERLARLETTTKEMLAESIAGSINKAKAKKNFDEEFERVANRKGAYKALTDKEKSEIKNDVRGRMDRYLATNSNVAPTDNPLTPKYMAGAVRAIVQNHLGPVTEDMARLGPEALPAPVMPRIPTAREVNYGVSRIPSGEPIPYERAIASIAEVVRSSREPVIVVIDGKTDKSDLSQKAGKTYTAKSMMDDELYGPKEEKIHIFGDSFAKTFNKVAAGKNIEQAIEVPYQKIIDDKDSINKRTLYEEYIGRYFAHHLNELLVEGRRVIVFDEASAIFNFRMAMQYHKELPSKIRVVNVYIEAENGQRTVRSDQGLWGGDINPIKEISPKPPALEELAINLSEVFILRAGEAANTNIEGIKFEAGMTDLPDAIFEAAQGEGADEIEIILSKDLKTARIKLFASGKEIANPLPSFNSDCFGGLVGSCYMHVKPMDPGGSWEKDFSKEFISRKGTPLLVAHEVKEGEHYLRISIPKKPAAPEAPKAPEGLGVIPSMRNWFSDGLFRKLFDKKYDTMMTIYDVLLGPLFEEAGFRGIPISIAVLMQTGGFNNAFIFASLAVALIVTFAAFVLLHPKEARGPPVLIGIMASLTPFLFLSMGMPLLYSLLATFGIHIIINSVALIQTDRDKFKTRAMIDELTKLGNRWAGVEALNTEIGHASRNEGRRLSFIIMDIDNFKEVNDAYGHQVGDDVLTQVADIVKKRIRQEDTVFRYGGEEIAVIVPESDVDGASALASDIRLAIENGTNPIKVTVSIGVSQYRRDPSRDSVRAYDIEDEKRVTEREIKGVIERADKALYLAKHEGKNTIRNERDRPGIPAPGKLAMPAMGCPSDEASFVSAGYLPVLGGIAVAAIIVASADINTLNFVLSGLSGLAAFYILRAVKLKFTAWSGAILATLLAAMLSGILPLGPPSRVTPEQLTLPAVTAAAPIQQAMPITTAPVAATQPAPVAPVPAAVEKAEKKLVKAPDIIKLLNEGSNKELLNADARDATILGCEGMTEEDAAKIEFIMRSITAIELGLYYPQTGNPLQTDRIWVEKFIKDLTKNENGIKDKNTALVNWLRSIVKILDNTKGSRSIKAAERIEALAKKLEKDLGARQKLDLEEYFLRTSRDLRGLITQDSYAAYRVGAYAFRRGEIDLATVKKGDYAAIAKAWKEKWNTWLGLGLVSRAEIIAMIADANEADFKIGMHIFNIASPTYEELVRAKRKLREIYYETRKKGIDKMTPDELQGLLAKIKKNEDGIKAAQEKFTVILKKLSGVLTGEFSKKLLAEIDAGFSGACLEAKELGGYSADGFKAKIEARIKASTQPKAGIRLNMSGIMTGLTFILLAKMGLAPISIGIAVILVSLIVLAVTKTGIISKIPHFILRIYAFADRVNGRYQNLRTGNKISKKMRAHGYGRPPKVEKPLRPGEEPKVVTTGFVGSPLLYKDPYRESLKLDPYDKAHYKWDPEIHRWYRDDLTNKKTVLGTWEDVQRAKKENPTDMKYHVVIRMKDRCSVYVFDAHHDSQYYLQEAYERNEIKRSGNKILWLDDHPDMADRNALADARIARETIENGWASGDEGAFMWGHAGPVWDKRVPVSGAWKIDKKLVGSYKSFNLAKYDSDPALKRMLEEDKLALIVDTDVAEAGPTIAFLNKLHGRTSTVHITTSPSETEELTKAEQDGAYGMMDGLISPEGYGTVEISRKLAQFFTGYNAEEKRPPRPGAGVLPITRKIFGEKFGKSGWVTFGIAPILEELIFRVAPLFLPMVLAVLFVPGINILDLTYFSPTSLMAFSTSLGASGFIFTRLHGDTKREAMIPAIISVLAGAAGIGAAFFILPHFTLLYGNIGLLYGGLIAWGIFSLKHIIANVITVIFKLPYLIANLFRKPNAGGKSEISPQQEVVDVKIHRNRARAVAIRVLNVMYPGKDKRERAALEKEHAAFVRNFDDRRMIPGFEREQRDRLLKIIGMADSVLAYVFPILDSYNLLKKHIESKEADNMHIYIYNSPEEVGYQPPTRIVIAANDRDHLVVDATNLVVNKLSSIIGKTIYIPPRLYSYSTSHYDNRYPILYFDVVCIDNKTGAQLPLTEDDIAKIYDKFNLRPIFEGSAGPVKIYGVRKEELREAIEPAMDKAIWKRNTAAERALKSKPSGGARIAAGGAVVVPEINSADFKEKICRWWDTDRFVRLKIASAIQDLGAAIDTITATPGIMHLSMGEIAKRIKEKITHPHRQEAMTNLMIIIKTDIIPQTMRDGPKARKIRLLLEDRIIKKINSYQQESNDCRSVGDEKKAEELKALAAEFKTLGDELMKEFIKRSDWVPDEMVEHECNRLKEAVESIKAKVIAGASMVNVQIAMSYNGPMNALIEKGKGMIRQPCPDDPIQTQHLSAASAMLGLAKFAGDYSREAKDLGNSTGESIWRDFEHQLLISAGLLEIRPVIGGLLKDEIIQMEEDNLRDILGTIGRLHNQMEEDGMISPYSMPFIQMLRAEAIPEIKNGNTATKAVSSIMDAAIKKEENPKAKRAMTRTSDMILQELNAIRVLDDSDGSIDLEKPIVIVTKNLDLYVALKIFRESNKIAAIITDEDVPTAHWAIVASSRVPVFTSTRSETGQAATSLINNNDMVFVYEMTGAIRAGASSETIMALDMKKAEGAILQSAADPRRLEDAKTTDGVSCNFTIDMRDPRDFRKSLDYGFKDVGLLRSELIYQESNGLPSDEELERIFTRIADATEGTVTIRMFDMQPDKKPSYLPHTGLKGTAYLLSDGTRDTITMPLLRAITRAYYRSKARNIRISFPNVMDGPEASQARSIATSVVADIKKELGLTTEAPNMPIGNMIEKKEAVDNRNDIAANSDFISIGTNDLSDDIRGINDRTSAAGSTEFPFELAKDIMLVYESVSRAKIPLSICGERAQDLETILVGLAVSQGESNRITFVVRPDQVARLKQIVRNTDISKFILEAKSYIAKFIEEAPPEESDAYPEFEKRQKALEKEFDALLKKIKERLVRASVIDAFKKIEKPRQPELPLEMGSPKGLGPQAGAMPVWAALIPITLAIGVVLLLVKAGIMLREAWKTTAKAKPSIVIGIPDIGESGKQDMLRIAINNVAPSFAERIEIVTLPGNTNDTENYEQLRSGPKKADIVIPIAREFVQSAGSVDDTEKRISKFLKYMTGEYFTHTNPDIMNWSDELSKINSAQGQRAFLTSVLARLTPVLQPAVAQRLATLDLYNTRMANIARQIGVKQKASPGVEAFIEETKEPHLLSMRADSFGEVKLLAEEHRNRMNASGKKDYPVKLQIRLTVKDENEKQKLELQKTALLQTMDIGIDTLSPEDLILVSGSEANALTVSGVYEKYTKTYDKKRVAIVDTVREGRLEEVPEGIVFMEYEEVANPRVYDAAIELIANKPAQPPPGFRPSDNGRWFILLPPVKKVEFKKLKQEIERYNAIIRSA